eukprot:scaffold247771_cov19-Tisochrysis_lutea.AAC.1
MGGMVLWGRAAGGLDGERKRSARLLLLLLLWLMQGLLVVLRQRMVLLKPVCCTRGARDGHRRRGCRVEGRCGAGHAPIAVLLVIVVAPCAHIGAQARVV